MFFLCIPKTQAIYFPFNCVSMLLFLFILCVLCVFCDLLFSLSWDKLSGSKHKLSCIFCCTSITFLKQHFRSSPAAPLVEISSLWCHTVHWFPLVSNHTSMSTVGSALCGRLVFPNMWEVQCLVCSYFSGVQDDRMKMSCSKSEDVALAFKELSLCDQPSRWELTTGKSRRIDLFFEHSLH